MTKRDAAVQKLIDHTLWKAEQLGIDFVALLVVHREGVSCVGAGMNDAILKRGGPIVQSGHDAICAELGKQSVRTMEPAGHG